MLRKCYTNPLCEVSATELSEEQKAQMLELLHKNYEKLYPGDENKEFRAEVETKLQESFVKTTTQFYLLEDNGKIVCFHRFDMSGYRSVGSEMLEKTINKRLESNDIIFAHCDPSMTISQKYCDGFKIIRHMSQVDLCGGN